MPGTMEDLLELPGVGRKTANLVLSACFGQPGIIVDTHVLRTCLRLGLGAKDDATDMEERIAELVPRERWTRLLARGQPAREIRLLGPIARLRCPVLLAPPCPLLFLCPRVGL